MLIKSRTSEKKYVRGAGFTDILNNAIGKLGDVGIELHLPAAQGEYIPGGSFNNQTNYSYCGPGTKYEQRNREGYQGINELDRMCKLHDKFYNENPDTKSRNVSDIALAHRASEIAIDPRFDSAQQRYANVVSLIMRNKAKFGLGINSLEKQNSTKSLNSKRGLTKRK